MTSRAESAEFVGWGPEAADSPGQSQSQKEAREKGASLVCSLYANETKDEDAGVGSQEMAVVVVVGDGGQSWVVVVVEREKERKHC